MGTTDNAALNLRANNNRVAQFGAYDVATGSPTILMGYSANTATLALNGSFIGSGGNLGNPNRVTDNYNAIVGGSGNRAGNLNASPSDAQYGFIGGGFGNTVANFYATIVGGQGNTANGEYTSMVGGQNNLANSNYTTVVGGSNNAARGFASSALSGTDNISLGNYSLIPGGIQNRARSFGEVVVGIYNDTLGYTGTANLNVATDRIFTIGNGTGLASRSNAMVVLKNGNVGLGTSTPAQRLHVVGGFQLQNGTENTGRVLTSDALGNASWVTPNVANGASVNQTLRWDGLAWAPNSMLRVGNPPSGVGINAAPSTSYFLWVDDTKIGTTPGVFFRSTAAQGVGGVNIPLQLQVSNAPTSVGLDVIGSAAATETVTGVRVAVSGAGTRYAATFLGGRVGVGTTTPTSTLQVDGSTSVAVLNTNTAFTFTETHNVIIHSATTNNTLNLPLANTCPGRIYTIKKTTTSNTSLRLAPAGADTVEGVAANYDPGISLAKTSYSVVSDGVSGWWVIHKSLNN